MATLAVTVAQAYVDRAKEDKLRYEREMKAYNEALAKQPQARAALPFRGKALAAHAKSCGGGGRLERSVGSTAHLDARWRGLPA